MISGERAIVQYHKGTVRKHIFPFLILFLVLISPARLCAGLTPLEDLYQLFHMEIPAADIVILLDASGSMVGKYDAARQGAVSFASTLTDKENLHLRLFATVTSAPLEGKGSEVGGRLDSYLPQTPLIGLAGRKTDLGLAVLKGLEFLEREGASRVQAFFLFTDGLHDPPSDSPYSRDFEGDPDWQDLRRRAHALCQDRTVFVYGFGIGQHTDIALMRRVFPVQKVELIVGSTTEAGNVLQQMRKLLRQAQLRQVVAKEFRTGKVEVQLPQTSLSQRGSRSLDLLLTIRSTYSHLPITITNITAKPNSRTSHQLECMLDTTNENTQIRPKGSIKQSVHVRIAQPTISRWHLGKVEKHYNGYFQIEPTARFVHEAPLKELGFEDPKPQVQPTSLTASLILRYGVPLWAAIGLLTSLISIVIGWRRLHYYKQPRALTSTFIRSGDRVEEIELNQFKKTTLDMGPGKDIDVIARATPPDGVVAALGLEEEGNFAYLTMESHSAEVRVNGETVTGVRRLAVGDNLQIGYAVFTVTGDTSIQVRFTRPRFLATAVAVAVVFTMLLLGLDP